MPKTIIAHPPPVDPAQVLADYAQRMCPRDADTFLGVRTGTVSAAIRRKEIRPYRFPDSPSRAWVTPAMLAEWLEGYCRGTEEGEEDGDGD